MGVQLIVMVCFGAATALVASRKGRSTVGWFFIGFFFTLLGLIVSLVVSDLKKEQEYQQHAMRERRRLREQLKQERMKSEAFRRHAQARLDSHDRSLEVDTRPAGLQLEEGTPPLLVGSGDVRAKLPPRPGGPRRPDDNMTRPTGPARRERQWYYETEGEQRGPIPESVVKDMLERGALTAETLLWAEGIGEWTPVARISTFRSTPPTTGG